MTGRKNSNLPLLAAYLLKGLTGYESDYAMSGDMEEEYRKIRKNKGSAKAAAWYWRQAVGSLPSYIKIVIRGGWAMFKSYLKIGIRNILKHKGYSFINIAGLAIGIACCILILFWVRDELSYDRFHQNGDELYRVIGYSQSVSGGLHLPLTPPPLAEALQSEFYEVAAATRMRFLDDQLVIYKNERYMESGILAVDPPFFSMFTFPFIHGKTSTALQNPNSLVITKRIAEKYFGKENPVGKILKVNNSRDFMVTGVIENPPRNSHIRFDFVIPFSILKDILKIRLDHWGDNSYYTYIRTQKGVSHVELSKKIANVQKDHNKQSTQILSLQPLKDIYLHSSFLNYSFLPLGDIKYVYLFSLLALLVLLIACINFISLSTARSANRAKEVGMRKVTGAQRKDLIKQFMGESFVFTLLAMVAALLIVSSLMPLFNELSGKEISGDIFTNVTFFLGMVVITLITGILSGLYPAIFLSGFQPIKVLKGISIKSGKGARVRKVLVVAQFSISILLIISTIAVYLQLDYVRDKKLGFNKEHTIYLPVRGEIKQKNEIVKKKLLDFPGIVGVSRCSDLPVFPVHLWGDLHWPGKDPKSRPEMNFFSTDFDFIDLFGIELAAGRKFSKDLPTDSGNYMINEAAARLMGMNEPVGKWFARGKNRGTIIGVIKDFHFSTLRKRIDPLVIQISLYFNFVFVKVKSTKIPGAIRYIEKTWKIHNPLFPMEYHFLDEVFSSIYRSEQRLSRLFRYFTLLA
ncbi:ABC transporter permease, partial [Acidobacteriota bacterium]